MMKLNASGKENQLKAALIELGSYYHKEAGIAMDELNVEKFNYFINLEHSVDLILRDIECDSL